MNPITQAIEESEKEFENLIFKLNSSERPDDATNPWINLIQEERIQDFLRSSHTNLLHTIIKTLEGMELATEWPLHTKDIITLSSTELQIRKNLAFNSALSDTISLLQGAIDEIKK